MTRREKLVAAVERLEAWKREFHYREGSLPWLLGGDWMYPYTRAWHYGKPTDVAPAVRVK